MNKDSFYNNKLILEIKINSIKTTLDLIGYHLREGLISEDFYIKMYKKYYKKIEHFQEKLNKLNS